MPSPIRVKADYITVIGGPAYNYATNTGYDPALTPYEFGVKTSSGVGIDSELRTVSGTNQGYRAVRVDASGTAIELGNLGTTGAGSTDMRAFSANALGTTVGYAIKYDAGVSVGQRAVAWNASGTPLELGNLGLSSSGTTSSQAIAINASGTIVGTAGRYLGGTVLGARPVVWDSAGNVTELGNIGTDASGFTAGLVSDINDAGSSAGYIEKYVNGVDKGQRPARWNSSGAITELDILGTDNSGNSSGSGFGLVYKINASGTAVGRAIKYASGLNAGPRAVRWDASGTAATELDNLGPDSNAGGTAVAYSVNSAGTAVGYAYLYDGPTFKGQRAVRWDASGTAATVLGALGTDSSGRTTAQANAINDAGLTVGYENAYDIAGKALGQKATLWQVDGSAVDLNTLIDPASGWTLAAARGITNDGWISGIGSFDPDGPGGLSASGRSFLIQLPEATSSLLGIGALIALLRRR